MAIEVNHKLVHGAFPIKGGSGFIKDVSQGQPQQLNGGFVSWEVASRFDDFAQLHFQALNGVGGVNHTPNVRGEGVERHHVFPSAAPRFEHHRVALAHVAKPKVLNLEQI